MRPDLQPPYTPPVYTRLERLFDSEEGSDVTFLVGLEPETWRFPGHTRVLSKSNPVFKAMLSQASCSTIRITDVDSRAFDLLLRYLYNEEVVLPSVVTALSTFYAAQKYLCSGLMSECLAYLDRHLAADNVLQVYEEMRLSCGQRRSSLDPWAPSAPPYHALSTDSNDNLDTVLDLCLSLLHNCLLFIDTHADLVLAQESLEDLAGDALKDLMDRDTLWVSSESVTYAALERWCNRECKRRQLEMCHESRRLVVGDELLFSVRYLLMSQHDFYSGPMAGNLLNKQEATTLIGLLMGATVTNSTPSLTQPILERLRRKRVRPTGQPLKLGRKPERCRSKNETKPKKHKKQRRKEKDGSPKRRCNGSCFLDCILRGLSCLFD